MSSLVQGYIQSSFLIVEHIADSSSDHASAEHRQSVMTIVSCNQGLVTLALTDLQRGKKKKKTYH